MEQTTMRLRRGGWSPTEADMLWETADEAQQQGLPLKSVFEHVAMKTGRRPNSIRNYYYAQVQKRLGDEARPARFVPFTQDEVVGLIRNVLIATAKGQSVRSCLKQMSNGDHSLMLRYQNKYRSIIKTRPDLVNDIVKQLNAEGMEVAMPCVSRRNRSSVKEACEHLNEAARQNENPDLIKACETLADFIAQSVESYPATRSGMGARIDIYRMALDDKLGQIQDINKSATGLITAIKEYLGQTPESRAENLDEFCGLLMEKIGEFEVNLQHLELYE
ncbi:MAG: hypothetical protein Q4D04_08760 [Clostridia bacterium]|nr:hypothetical protein [Clostridia bacterium]